MFVLAREIGMSYEDYWYKDPQLYFTDLRAYNNRKKTEFDDQNYFHWQQGSYFLLALNQALQGFSKKPKQIYPKEPLKKADELKKAQEMKHNTDLVKDALRKFFGNKKKEVRV